MKPPIVVLVTKPSSHKISSIIAIVYNIIFLSVVYRRTRCRPPAMNQGYLLVGQRHGLFAEMGVFTGSHSQKSFAGRTIARRAGGRYV